MNKIIYSQTVHVDDIYNREGCGWKYNENNTKVQQYIPYHLTTEWKLKSGKSYNIIIEEVDSEIEDFFE